MRIGLVCPYSFDAPGGVQAHILDLAGVLRRRGHHVEVLGPAGKNAELPDFVTRGGGAVPIVYNGSVARLAIGPQVPWHVRRFIKRGRFDVLHLHEPNSPSFSMAALAMASGPIVATYHASASRSRVLRFFLPILRPFLEKIRAGIAVSELARRWQVEQLGGDPVLIPNGVETARFTAADRHVDDDNDDERPLTVAFLGRLDEPRKGLGVLSGALSRLSEADRSRLRLTVMGGGRSRLRSHGVPVRALGRVSEEVKAAELGRADIYVAPNTGGESFGIVLVEAMAAGCAVVASDLEAFGAVCAAETESPAGLLFDTGSADGLARALEWLIHEPAERRRLAAAGRERARAFDWERVADQILAVYETVADGTTVDAR